MTNKWVDRDGANNIITVYGSKQFSGQENMDDKNQEILDFFDPPYAITVTEARQRKRREELKKAIDTMIRVEKEIADKKKQAKKAQENAKKLEEKKSEKTGNSK